MSEKIEKLFKNALEQVSVEPPARVWEGINSHFVMKQRRLRRIYTYSGIAAAVILLFGGDFSCKANIPISIPRHLLPL